MPFPLPKFEAPDAPLEREDKGKPLSQEERIELVSKYLTPDGRGNELFAGLCLGYFTPVVGRIIGGKYPDSVEDVVQVAALKATLGLGQFSGGSSLKTWLFKIGANESLDFLRKVKSRKDISNSDPLEEVMENGEDFASQPNQETGALNAELLEKMLACLDEHQKHLIILHHLEGYSPEEMAKMLDMNENTVKVQLFRARQAMLAHARKRLL